MAKSYGGITVDISGNYDNSDIQKAIRDLRALDNSAATSQKAFGGFDQVARMAGAAIAGMAAAAGALAIKLGVEGVQAALADQRAKEGLAKTLDNLNLAHETSAVEAYIDTLQRSSGVADDVLRPAYDRLIRSIGDTEQAQKALQLTLDIAAGTGRDAQQVAMALGRAYDGSTTALGRLGAGIDASILKTKDMDLITQRLSDTFGGQANVAASTYQGRINRLTVAADELKEAFGYGLLNNMDSVFNQTGSATRAMQGLEGIIGQAGKQIGYMISGLNILVSRLSDLDTATEGTDEEQNNLLVTLAKIGYLLNPLTAGVVLFGDSLIGAGKDAETLADGVNTARDSVIGLLLAQRANEQTGRQLAATAYDSGLARLAEAEHTRRLTEILGHVPGQYEEIEKKSKSSGASSTKSLKDLREEFEKTFNQEADARIKTTLETLKKGLDDAQQKFDQFRTGLSTSIFGQLDPSQAVDTAKETGGSIVDAFVKQAAGVQKFGEQLQQLLQTNLSEEAFALVAQMSAEKGTLLASELLGANGQYFIDNFNKSVEAVKTVADLVGQLAAEKWYQAGVDSAQKTYEGFKENFGEGGPAYNAMQRVMNRLADSMRRETTITVTTINRTINEVFDRFGGPRAAGGPVSANTAYMVGERGPELFIPDVPGAIVPNHALGSSSGGGISGGGTINLTVNAGMGTDGGEVGRQIVEALRQYQRRNGPVPITVA